MSTNISNTVLTVGQSSKEATISQMFSEIDAGMSETLSIDLTSANASLTASQMKASLTVLAINATVSGRTVTLNATSPVKRFLLLANAAANTQNVAFVVGSTSITLAPGQNKLVYLDGTTNGMVKANQSSFAELLDVNESTPPTNGQTLRFDSASGKWVPWGWITTTQTASYTFVAADANTTVEYNSSSAGTFTIPPNSSVAFPLGTALEIIQQGTAAITVAPGSGVTLDGPVLVTGTRYERMIARQVATNEWNVVALAAGSGSTALSALSDVNVTEGAGIDGFSLVWNNSTSKWIASNVSGGGGALSGLSDVNVTEGAPIDGYSLVWNQATTRWIATHITGGGGSSIPDFVSYTFCGGL